MDLMKKSLEMHKEFKGKMEIVSKVPLKDSYDLSLAYSPGVAAPCQEIEKSPMRVYDYTMKGNLVAVVSDGTAVLGLGDIGPEAALPVMEGKALLLKRFANVDAVPITLNTKDVDEIVRTVKAISPTFGAINLEDIAAPRCFEIEERLKAECNIPIFHDDQHGTAIVVAAGLENALKLVGKRKEEVKIVINGAGAAGIATLKLLASIGYKNIVVCDSKGILYEGRSGMNAVKEEIAKITNPEKLTGTLDDAMVGTDIFIGVSIANILTKEHIDSMNRDPIVFALANPNPEITYENAERWGVRIIGTGRSDYPNQVNNVLAFPGIFRGALDVFATEINEEMKIAAVNAIASLVDENELREDYVIPKPLDERVVPAVAKAVANAAIETGVSRLYSNQQAKVI
ncbi:MULTISPECIES: NAD(P)-dependent malic enzyme [Ureibacillus]|jgi:malate dehydrogenase (oxaloacetate-decarboxylating)|uniref:Malate dehydrogenase (Oxaloacetate-decarboxylating) n=1 Tax=Ureibacillus thermosphaericus TaxID=51173 RepID=A0A840PS73_URETH|nr:malic enzyme-like NAD(P)-binding protein [Ureibacillus thermosphaericus]MBB5147631.1 malate dehydrogenase (oxaloacetate-decarboxylating) [Ureibacillus thermosphaericus]NKZ30564.1 NAD-dependent malic enzyme [Ureibacillus thermosphaericus]